MVVQHNLRAMNANRMLGITTGVLSKSSEKLSSGYKINRAADDAAGLSISEKMRRQVRGLTQASANAQDGISVVQTAEGALNEVEDMLQRMNELAVKGENGTLTTSDRASIQAEIGQLMSEVDRVQSTTTFNEMNLLDGAFIKGIQVGAEAGQHIDISIANMSMAGLAHYIGTGWEKGSSENSKLYGAITFNALVESKNVSYTATTYTLKSASGYTGIKADGTKDTATNTLQGSINDKATTTTYSTVNPDTKKYNLKALTREMANKVVSTFQNLEGGKAKTVATTKDFNSLNAFIKGALQIVSSQRSDLGAIQNRLEHTINNLDVAVENLSAANSRIRDTDMAKEMMNYTKMNVLVQSAQAMLAQANQQPQSVLQLLQ